MPLPKTALPLVLLGGLFASCASGPPAPNPEQTRRIEGVYVNPYPEGTYQHFTADPSYPRTYKVYKNQAALNSGAPTRVTIDLSLQRGILYKGEQVAIDYPISSGKSAFPTPTGKFKVLEKLKEGKRSNLYGKIYDAEGNVVNSDADASKDEIPEGGKFVGASMPYWMRLTWTGVGMHRGSVPRYPASHGCIRTYSTAVSTVYSHVDIGTPVDVVQ